MRMVQQEKGEEKNQLKPPQVKQLSPIKFKECFEFCMHRVGL